MATTHTKVLVVDDSPVERVLVEGLLRNNSDYTVQLAEDGRAALDSIAADPPDLVITDLVMPEMDGLELVRTVRERWPCIPVILMTAFGDEMTAVEALEAGAASYFSKAHKAERLLTSVQRVLDNALANRSHEHLTRRMLEYHCRFALENDRRLIRTFVAEIERMMAGMEFGNDVDRIRVGEALEEALLNAMFHGNLEIERQRLSDVRAELDDAKLEQLVAERNQDPAVASRRILVVAHLTKSESRFVIRDEGRGFDTESVTGDAVVGTATAAASRGMTLIRSLMDEVKFNNAGNELVIRKLLGTPEPAEDPSAGESARRSPR